MVLASDGPGVRREITRLLNQARHSVNVIMPGSYERARPFAPLLGRLTALRGSGVTVRALCSPGVVAPLALAAAARRDTNRCDLRVSEVGPQGMLIVDGRQAFGRTGPARGGRRLSLIADPAAVRALDLMFAGAWSSAMPLAEHLRLSERLRTDSVRLILERLRAGRTDDVAAKEMQVSLRTYRRHVAAIMREVGANSRFQAGVRAVELGLLS